MSFLSAVQMIAWLVSMTKCMSGLYGGSSVWLSFVMPRARQVLSPTVP
jgi:hypothetical protein